MLVPENTMKKQADFLIACFFLSSLVFFFTAGRINLGEGFDFGFETVAYRDFDEEYTKAQIRAARQEMSRILSTALADEGIFPQEILTSVNISDKYSISINEIRLVFLKKEDEENDEEIEMLKQAVYIVQKEVGGDILITGEFSTLDVN
jgi:hypothetical protein